MFGVWFGKEAAARALNRDARVIIEDAREAYRAELVRDIALMARARLQEISGHLEAQPERRHQYLHELQRLHREARRAYQQGPLTAYTLVIIYLKSEPLGELAQPARDAIDDFIAQWEHAVNGDPM